MNLKIGPFLFHQKEQFDLKCKPILAIHINTQNRSARLLCVWKSRDNYEITFTPKYLKGVKKYVKEAFCGGK